MIATGLGARPSTRAKTLLRFLPTSAILQSLQIPDHNQTIRSYAKQKRGKKKEEPDMEDIPRVPKLPSFVHSYPVRYDRPRDLWGGEYFNRQLYHYVADKTLESIEHYSITHVGPLIKKECPGFLVYRPKNPMDLIIVFPFVGNIVFQKRRMMRMIWYGSPMSGTSRFTWRSDGHWSFDRTNKVLHDQLNEEIGFLFPRQASKFDYGILPFGPRNFDT